MKKFIISESQYNKLLEISVPQYTDKVLMVKNFLDKHFVRGDKETNEFLTPNKSVVISINDMGQPVGTLSFKDLFFLIQDQFKEILPDINERHAFLKQIIKDWYNKKISKDGLLSINF